MLKAVVCLGLAASCLAQQTFVPSIPPRSKDTDASNLLFWKAGSNLTANRDFTLATGDANRTLTLNGDASLDQSLLTSASPAFAATTLTCPSSPARWFYLKPEDYGSTSYSPLGTPDGWSFITKNGTNWPTNWTGRADRNYIQGYNIGADGTPVNTNEPAYSQSVEVCWLINDSLAGTTDYTASSKVFSAGNTTVTAASGSPFLTGSTALQRSGYIYFKNGTSNRVYAINGWTSNTVARVAGDCSAEIGTFQVLTVWVERYDTMWWANGGGVSTQWNKTVFDQSLQTVRSDWKMDDWYIYDSAGTLRFGFRNGSGNTGNFYMYTNNRYILGRNTSGTSKEMLGINASNQVQVGYPSDGLAGIKLASDGGVINTVTAGIAAAGTTQGAATALNSTLSEVTSVTGGSAEAVRLTHGVGATQTIRNATASTLKVFPPTSGTINGGAANTSVDLAANTTGQYFHMSTNGWYSK